MNKCNVYCSAATSYFVYVCTVLVTVKTEFIGNPLIVIPLDLATQGNDVAREYNTKHSTYVAYLHYFTIKTKLVCWGSYFRNAAKIESNGFAFVASDSMYRKLDL